MSALPTCETLEVRLEAGRLDVTFNRPRVRNAMSLAMVSELEAVLDAVREDRGVRVIVLRGAGGNFCAGGDVKDMATARAAAMKGGEPDPLAVVNRRFGALLTRLEAAPQATVAVLEGAVMGGGLGVACVTDVAVAVADAKLRLPETGLGLPPAQIAPFLVRRLGLSRARQLAVTGARLDGRGALEVGLVHHVARDAGALAGVVDQVVARILACAPGAVATTKELLLRAGIEPLEGLLDDAAAAFAAAARGEEGTEGTMAFLHKRKPSWAPEGEP